MVEKEETEEERTQRQERGHVITLPYEEGVCLV